MIRSYTKSEQAEREVLIGLILAKIIPPASWQVIETRHIPKRELYLTPATVDMKWRETIFTSKFYKVKVVLEKKKGKKPWFVSYIDVKTRPFKTSPWKRQEWQSIGPHWDEPNLGTIGNRIIGDLCRWLEKKRKEAKKNPRQK